MNSSQHNLSTFSTAAMSALRRAFEECPTSTAGSFIIIASNAIIRLEDELQKGNTLPGRNLANGSSHFHQGDFGAAA